MFISRASVVVRVQADAHAVAAGHVGALVEAGRSGVHGICMYIYIYIYTCIHTYIYIYREREI